jgi:hypothetical protein
MLRWAAACIVLSMAVLALIAQASFAGVSYPVVDTTITVKDSGAIHVKVVQTVPDDKEGATEYHFDLQKMYDPEYVYVYDYETHKPLQFETTNTSDTIGYAVHFGKPYYKGYTFVVEYDCHRRIIYEGTGVYSFGMRSAIDTRRVDRTYTIVFPPRNFTYLGYTATLDHPVSETETGGSVTVVFHGISEVGADHAWEVRFGATGIDNEVRKLNPPSYTLPVPGMSFTAAIAALVIFAIVRKR